MKKNYKLPIYYVQNTTFVEMHKFYLFNGALLFFISSVYMKLHADKHLS